MTSRCGRTARDKVGRRLLAFAEAEARRRGHAAVRLYTHATMTRNIRLYQALGYAVTGRRAVDAGHLVHLRKLVPRGG